LLERADGFICTRRAAERRLPLLANHQLPTVMKAFGLAPSTDHDGLEDAWGCFRLVERFAKPEWGYQTLADWLATPILLEVMPFSKRWKGVAFGEIESGFLEWCLKQADMNEDVVFTAEWHLAKRRNDAEQGMRARVLFDQPDDDVPWS
jgi:hypothetical protein